LDEYEEDKEYWDKYGRFYYLAHSKEAKMKDIEWSGF